MRKWISYILPLIFVAFGCTTTQKLDRVNLAHLYYEDGVVLKPLFKIYHQNADTSSIYFEGSSDQLLYVKNQSADNYMAKMGIQYKLFTDYSRTVLVDTGSFEIKDVKTDPKSAILKGVFALSTHHKSPDNKYILEIILTDKNRNLSYFNILQLDKSNTHNRQNFVQKTAQGDVVFREHFPLHVPFILSHNSQPKSYTVRYYHRDFPLAATPYSDNTEVTFKYAADSIFTVDANAAITLKKPGFYHFLVDENQKKGFTVFNFSPNFPFVTNREDLGPPLRYLTTQSEYAVINVADEFAMKLEVDKFWLKMGGTVDRGKMLISAYYNRIEGANKHFTSYLEGWKTDRGIIYVILGPPTQVTRNEFQETWIYGDPNSSLNYVFVFTKLKNPFTDNDYGLNRSNSYRYGWAQAIESWRNGRIFGIKEIKRAQDERDRQTRVNTPPYFWY